MDVHSEALFRGSKIRPAPLMEKSSNFKRFSSFTVMYPLNGFLARRAVGFPWVTVVDKDFPLPIGINV
jgi:hypothetical protein